MEHVNTSRKDEFCGRPIYASSDPKFDVTYLQFDVITLTCESIDVWMILQSSQCGFTRLESEVQIKLDLMYGIARKLMRLL